MEQTCNRNGWIAAEVPCTLLTRAGRIVQAVSVAPGRGNGVFARARKGDVY